MRGRPPHAWQLSIDSPALLSENLDSPYKLETQVRRPGFALLLLCFIAVSMLATMTAAAQSVAGASCDAFKNAQGAQQAEFVAYIQGYANASSPDPRYTQSESALADDVKKVHDWCGKNGKRSFNEGVAAVLGSASSGGGSAPVPAAQTAEPTSCKVGPTQYCGGCSVTCNAPKQAHCNMGTDSPFGKPECEFQGRCWCK